MRYATCAILLAACGFDHGLNPIDASIGIAPDGAGHDAAGAGDGPAGHDAAVATDAQACPGTGLGVQICLAHQPTQDLTVTFVRAIDTGVGSNDCVDLTGPSASDYCVMAGTNITISGTLVATGTRPLVLVATGTITVNGTIDVGSHLAVISTRGAGADPSACVISPAPASTGGGAGGSFGSKGGDGGNGSLGASAASAVTVTELRGGCPGSAGQDHTTLGGPGHGGGAVDLIALTSIRITGKIDASGEGGAGAGITHNGGDGGGSGGLIVLDAPSVVFGASTQLYANGGGGGGGSTTGIGIGGDGGDPTSPAAGGQPGTAPGGAADGGTGAHGTAPGQSGASSTTGDGGGGGGGGVGAIRVFQSPLPTGGSVSPPL